MLWPALSQGMVLVTGTDGSPEALARGCAAMGSALPWPGVFLTQSGLLLLETCWTPSQSPGTAPKAALGVPDFARSREGASSHPVHADGRGVAEMPPSAQIPLAWCCYLPGGTHGPTPIPTITGPAWNVPENLLATGLCWSSRGSGNPLPHPNHPTGKDIRCRDPILGS